MPKSRKRKTQQIPPSEPLSFSRYVLRYVAHKRIAIAVSKAVLPVFLWWLLIISGIIILAAKDAWIDHLGLWLLLSGPVFLTLLACCHLRAYWRLRNLTLLARFKAMDPEAKGRFIGRGIDEASSTHLDWPDSGD